MITQAHDIPKNIPSWSSNLRVTREEFGQSFYQITILLSLIRLPENQLTIYFK